MVDFLPRFRAESPEKYTHAGEPAWERADRICNEVRVPHVKVGHRVYLAFPSRDAINALWRRGVAVIDGYTGRTCELKN